MKKIIGLFICMLLGWKVHGQITGYDTTIFSGNDLNVFEEKRLLVNSKNEKFIISSFKNSYANPYDTLYSILTPTIWDQSKALFIEKYDQNNQYLWAKKILESDTLINFDIVIDGLDRICIVVNYQGTLHIPNDSIPGYGKNDFTVCVFNSDCNLQWYNTVGSIFFEQAVCITSDKNANLYLSGVVGYNNDTTMQTMVYFDSILSPPTWDFMAKMDSSGHFLWVKDAEVERIENMVVNGNAIYASGRTKPYDSFLGVPINAMNCGCGQVNFVGKMDTSGHGLWTRYFGLDITNYGSYLNKIKIASKANRLSATSNSYSMYANKNIYHFENGPTITGYGDGHDCFIYTLDTNGTFQWNNVSKSHGDEYYARLAIDTTGNTYAIGVYDYIAMFSTDTSIGYGGDDIVTVKYDSSGNYQWNCRAGGNSGELGRDIQLDSNQIPFVLASTKSPWLRIGIDSIELFNDPSLILLSRIGPLKTPASSTVTEIQIPTVYPNPSSENIFITYDDWRKEEDYLELRNSLGQIVASEKPRAQKETLSMNVQHLESGEYFLTAHIHHLLKTTKLFIQKK